MKLTFYGAAKQVTGSMFLLELEDDFRVLIDCGTNLSSKSKQENTESPFVVFPFDASLINLVVLTHAHIDHSGQVPNLYRYGFEGQVICTSPTLELTEILLHDSASLNQRKLQKISGKKFSTKKNRNIAAEELYLQRQVVEAIDNFVPIAFGKKFKFKDDGFLTLYPAGHLLGAAHIVFEIYENGKQKSIAFSGDLGRKNYPLLVDPTPLPAVDHLVMETTYGDRHHQIKDDALDVLEKIIYESCVEKPGRLIIPAFSIGRTQALLFTLNQLFRLGRLPEISIFTDSPLAKKSTQIYEKYSSYLNTEAKEFKKEEDNLFDFANLHFLASEKDSKEVANHSEPCIIISSSGMVSGGRVERHVAQNIGNPYATILMIGYATEGTLGHSLINGTRTELTIQGKTESVQATIKSVDVFSGHGDFDDLMTFATHQDATTLKNLFLVHGEPNSMMHFQEALNEKGFTNVHIPEFKDTFEL